MILTEYPQKLILKYFISAIGEFQNNFLGFNLGFHVFGPFRNLTRHCTADLSADIFVYMTYRQFFYT